jgi:ABC transport system ATP-binding/permease protein
VAPAASPPPRASAPKAPPSTAPSAGPRTPKKPAWQTTTPAGAEPPDPLDPIEAAARAETARRSRLETRVWGGKASVTEIRQLRDLCAREGDRACYDRAKLLLDADARLP